MPLLGPARVGQDPVDQVWWVGCGQDYECDLIGQPGCRSAARWCRCLSQHLPLSTQIVKDRQYDQPDEMVNSDRH
jgi:hypothetical protein